MTRQSLSIDRSVLHGAIVVALATWGAPLCAAAAEPAVGERVEFAWVRGEGAESCKSGSEVAQEIALRLERDPFVPGAYRSIEAFVSRQSGTWMADIRIRDRGQPVGTRHLTSESNDCDGLVAASVLAIALIIDPDATRKPIAERPHPSAPPPPPPPPPVVPIPPPPVAAPPLLPIETNVTLRLGVALDLLPQAAPVLAGSACVGKRPRPGIGHSMEGCGGALWLPETRTGDRDFAFGLTAGWLGACLHAFAFTRGTLSTCASLYGGAVHAVVFTLEPTEPGDRFWAAASLSERLRIRLPAHFALEAGVEGIAPLRRHRFLVEGRPEPVFSEPPLAALFFFGVGTSIP